MQEFFDWFRWLYDATGINLTIFYDSFDRNRFVNGFFTTLRLATSCVILSVAVGVAGAWLQGSRLQFTRKIVYWYIQFFRNTPPLVQLYFFYFGVGHLFTGAGGVPIVTNMQWAIFALSLYAGAFNVEIFRSGIEAVPTATIEAAESLGFSRMQVYRQVVLPLALRVTMPAMTNNLVNLVKTTTLAYAIAVPELVYMSAQIWSEQVNVPEMMVVLLICYVAMVGVINQVMQWLEVRLRVPGFGQ
jgi:polar amino acid transport system permease protein